MAIGRHCRIDKSDPAIFADHIGRPVRARHDGQFDIIAADHGRTGDANREFVAAFLDRKFRQLVDGVRRHTDQRCTGFGKIIAGHGKLPGFDRAARCEGSGEEIEDNRPFFQRIGQRETELLAANGAWRREIGRERANRQCGLRQCGDCKGNSSKQGAHRELLKQLQHGNSAFRAARHLKAGDYIACQSRAQGT